MNLVVLLLSIAAALLHDPVVTWPGQHPKFTAPLRTGGVIVLSFLLSSLIIAVLWSLYFLTDVVNRKA
jgi:hypothetical protein